MKPEISKVYDPKQVEDRTYASWENAGYFGAKPDTAKKPYSIVIPPPNVTDRLHMGHAFNNTIQDMLIRYHRMAGFNALWIPGTDHAGIATQNVVERSLSAEGISRHDLGREKFVEKVWEWREEHGSIIINQLKKLGCSCDWSRTRFTMDEDLSGAVIEAFVRLYEKGLIYRGKYIVNWCPRCHTAISDEEVNHFDEKGSLWYIKYPVKDSEAFLIVATTRPETMLGDTGVAVHPDDQRYKKLVGKTAILPILNREMPIFTDEIVDPSFGTGAVKVTPAHDPNDFDIGQRHNLPAITVIDIDGKMNKEAGPYAGMDRFEARKQIVKELGSLGLLDKIEKHEHSIGHCQRCDTIIEPYLSEQWFVKIKPLAEPALQVVLDGEIQILPARWIKVYENWMRNIRDWCISRQLWWGHRIPVYYCRDCDEMMVLRDKPDRCSKCGSENFDQDPDVLDTWFSSWLWPFSTMGWPEGTEDQGHFYPTTSLVTGPDIIFFWVARMIMSGLEFKRAIPFRHVYFNGIVRDESGVKMSKSRGNGIDPLEMIDIFSADAVRFSLIGLSAEGQDINLAENDFEMGRNFANKVWNAFRFLRMAIGEEIPAGDLSNICANHPDSMELADRWILSRYTKTIDRATTALEKFRFSEYLDRLHAFFWGDFCDWYVELIKPRLYNRNDSDNGRIAAEIAIGILKSTMKMLHPVIPFITEEIWKKLRNENEAESIMVSAWPIADRSLKSAVDEKDMSQLQESVPPGRKANVVIRLNQQDQAELLQANQSYLCSLAAIEQLAVTLETEKPPQSASAVVRDMELYVLLEGLIDVDLEKERLRKEIDRMEDLLGKLSGKLRDHRFMTRAPKAVIEKERDKKTSYEENLEKLRRNYSTLVE
jgi:valyl-tRNA synthetase